MTKKYRIHNQLTGLQDEANSFEDAKLLQQRLKQEYYESIESLFNISVLTENEDGSWTQSLSDDEGNPIITNIPQGNPNE